MKIPAFQNIQVIDKSGKFTGSWLFIMQQLFNQMQCGVSDDGYQVPNRTTEEITQIFTVNNGGRLLYDSNTDELKVNINGVPKVVQVV